MLANRPKGISINKNALNIQANQGLGRTPSPPKLKSYATGSSNTQQLHQLDDQPLKLQPLIPVKETFVESENDDICKHKNLIDLKGFIQCDQPKLALKKQSENDDVVISPLHRAKQQADQAQNLPGLQIRSRQTTAQQPQQQTSQLVSKIPRLVEVEVEEEIEDIDKVTSRDAVFLVCDVAQDVYEYMYKLEEALAIRKDYLKDQKIFTPKIRHRLVNWCIDTKQSLDFSFEALYMAISIMDRYFNCVTVKQQSQVQLVAVGAILIASKYEDIYPPEIEDLLRTTENHYSREAVMRIEIDILEKLNFDLGKPIPLAFLRRYSRAAHCDVRMHSLGKFLMEISLTEYECAHWKPSMLAATALFVVIHLISPQNRLQDGNNKKSTAAVSAKSGYGLSRRLVFGNSTNTSSVKSPPRSPERWNKSLVHYTHYTRKELQEPAGVVCKILKKVLKSPSSYSTARNNLRELVKWPEIRSTRVDELIRLGDKAQQQFLRQRSMFNREIAAGDKDSH